MDARQMLGQQQYAEDAMQQSAQNYRDTISNVGMQNAVAAVTLLSQIASAHALADSLGEVVNGLEKRLSPVLSMNYPDGQGAAPAISCDPPAIEEMDRLLNRLRSVIAYIDSIERRTRI